MAGREMLNPFKTSRSTAFLVALLFMFVHHSTGMGVRSPLSIDIYFNTSLLYVSVSEKIVHQRILVDGGVHVVVLHEGRREVVGERAFPTTKPFEARLLTKFLSSFHPNRIFVLAMVPDGALYLSPAEHFLRRLGCLLLFSTGVGEAWAAIIKQGVVYEGVVTRPHIPLHTPTTYETVMTSNKLCLGLSVTLDARNNGPLCEWYNDEAMSEQQQFCDRHDGFPELCRCENPLTPKKAFASSPRIHTTETIPCVIVTTNKPYDFYRLLIQLVQVAGGAQTPFIVRLEGDSPVIEDLVRLFGITLSKHHTPRRSLDLSGATQMIADVIRDSVNETLNNFPEAKRVIVMESDLVVSPDILRYFHATARLLDADSSLLAVTAYRQYSLPEHGLDPSRLMRGVVPPQWGWMSTKKLIENWVPDFWGDWDYWVLLQERLGNFNVVFPEISRSLHMGSNGTHIDGFAQTQEFNRVAANANPLVDFGNIDSLIRKNYSTFLDKQISSATAITLNDLAQCGPNLLPENREGPFTMYITDGRELAAIFACLKKSIHEPREDFENVLSMPVWGRRLYIVQCPQSRYCVSRPKDYLPVPHNDSFIEAVFALDQFEKSLDSRTPFRIRRFPSNLEEEFSLGNFFTGYTALGLDIVSLYLDKALVLPHEDARIGSIETAQTMKITPTYKYYATCVSKACAVADPLLSPFELPQELGLVADLALRRKTTCRKPTSVFTVMDYLENNSDI